MCRILGKLPFFGSGSAHVKNFPNGNFRSPRTNVPVTFVPWVWSFMWMKVPRNWTFVLGNEIQSTGEEKDLGVVVHKSLKVSSQCKKVVKEAYSILGVINRCFLNKTKDILVPLYKSLVRSRLEYCMATLFSQGYWIDGKSAETDDKNVTWS